LFQLTKFEWQELITNCDNLTETAKFTPVTPFSFTEQGVSMLSSVLKSKKAIQINIAIIRTFVMIRQYALNYKDLNDRLREVEGRFPDIYKAINYLMEKDKISTEQKERKRIGFKTSEE
jgi:hypothetical protein